MIFVNRIHPKWLKETNNLIYTKEKFERYKKFNNNKIINDLVPKII